MVLVVISAFAAIASGSQSVHSVQVPVAFGKDLTFNLLSEPVKYQGQDLNVFSGGKARAEILRGNADSSSRLSVTVECGVLQYSNFDYKLSASVYDKSGKLMGVASAIERVQYIRMGVMPMIFRKIDLDFGTGQDWTKAVKMQLSINSPNIPKPADA